MVAWASALAPAAAPPAPPGEPPPYGGLPPPFPFPKTLAEKF